MANSPAFKFSLVCTHQPRSWERNIPLWKTMLVDSHHGHDAAMDGYEIIKTKFESTTL